MVRQRPLPSRPQPQPKVIVESQPDPQIPFLVHREVMEKIPPAMAEALQQFMGCSIFLDFCQLSVAECEKKINDLRSNPNWTNEQYAKFVNDLRLNWRFWTDLLQFAEEFKVKL